MQDRFANLVKTLREYDIAVDEPWLHGLITSAAMIPDPDLARLQEAFADGRPLAEVVLSAALDSIDGVTDELETLDYRALVNGNSEESVLRWIDGFVDGIRIHEEQWEELTGTCLDAGLYMIMLQGMQNPTALEGLDLDLPGREALKGDPDLLTNATLAAWAALSSDSEDGFALPYYSERQLAARDELELMEIVRADGDRLPREVIEECARRSDAIVPLLLRHLEDEANWREGVDDHEWWALLHAIHILGLIPGQAAADALLSAFRLANIDDQGNLSDWLAGAWPALFRNKPAFATARLRQIANDSGAPWYARCQAANCVLASAESSGSEALEQAIDWLAAKCADVKEDPEFRVMAGHSLLDLPRERHRAVLEELVKLQEPGSLMELAYEREDIERSFDTGDEPEWHQFADPWQFYAPEQIVRRQERWLREEEYLDDVEPFVREQRKIGRNEPCPCGSGKKYKKCCMNS